MRTRAQELIDDLGERAAVARVPLYASLELTWRCNFRCVHCYQDGQRDQHRELDTAEWKRLLDELAGQGGLFLTFTGGDALVRRDFPEIYEHAASLGFVITVFTNGSLIDDDLLDLWSRLPPQQIEITLYGASPESYQRVVGQGAWHAPVMANIDRLLARGFRVVLKAPAMRPLLGDLEALAKYAMARGLDIRFDTSLFPRLDGSRAPLQHRLSPEETVALTRDKPWFQAQLEACFAGVSPELGERVYRCGAATNALNIDPSGHLQPCVISRGASGSWRELGTAGAWAALAPEGAREHALDGGCGSCGSLGGCSRCPGLSWMEKGHVEERVEHHCGVTAVKLRILGRAA